MPTEIKNKVFCVLPFYQTVVRTNGAMNPCCKMTQESSNLYKENIKQYWNSDALKTMRNSMLAGDEKIPACSHCYNDEAQIGKSMRTESLRDHKFLSDQHYEKLLDYLGYSNSGFPKRIEIHLGNLCNLKCLTCRPEDSSALLAENISLKISNHKQSDYTINQKIIHETIDLAVKEQIETLDLRGGETMFLPEIKTILMNLPRDHGIKTLRLQTNGTVMSEQWKKIFQSFKNLEIMLSIDAYDQDNYYIRYPAQWSQIEKNLDYMKTLPNAKIYVNCTVSNMNFLLLDKLLDWCLSKNVYFHFTPLTEPSEFRYTNLPADLFALACEKLKNYNQVAALLTTKPNNEQWKKFCNIINLRDTYRKNSIFDILPEFQPYWIKS